tara:strand:- start:616 stop:1353 length:738 start_codon:yes stop_codon:yes gene_type:complete
MKNIKNTKSNLNNSEKEYFKKSYELFLNNYKKYYENPFMLTSRQSFASSYARIKIYELVKNIKGSIVECGVNKGNNLLLFYHLLACNEPTSFNDKVIGFDSFEGFQSIDKIKDNKKIKKDSFKNADYNHLSKITELNQLNDIIKNIPRVQIVRGDAVKTIPKYVKNNKSLIIRLLYLDFDLYKPTIVALKNLYDLVPIGGVIVFDEIGNERWVGETIAYKEFFNKNKVRLKKFDFEPYLSYFIKE